MQTSVVHAIHLYQRNAFLIVSGALPAARPSRIVKSKVVTP